jgi:hypothetical protein
MAHASIQVVCYGTPIPLATEDAATRRRRGDAVPMRRRPPLRALPAPDARTTASAGATPHTEGTSPVPDLLAERTVAADGTSASGASAVAAIAALDPTRLPAPALPALLVALAGLQTRVAARLVGLLPPERPGEVARLGGARDAAGTDAWISVADAARRLAVSPKTLYRHRHRYPFVREATPGHWRVSVTALDRWMASRRPPPTLEPVEL